MSALEKITAIQLDWQRDAPGVYIAVNPADPRPHVQRLWRITRHGPRRWALDSITRVHQDNSAMPPLTVTTINHGTAYTLREAKEILTNFTDHQLRHPV